MIEGKSLVVPARCRTLALWDRKTSSYHPQRPKECRKLQHNKLILPDMADRCR